MWFVLSVTFVTGTGGYVPGSCVDNPPTVLSGIGFTLSCCVYPHLEADIFPLIEITTVSLVRHSWCVSDYWMRTGDILAYVNGGEIGSLCLL